MKCTIKLFTLLVVVPIATALNVFRCLDLWQKEDTEFKGSEIHKHCIDGFLKGVPDHRTDKNVNNYLNSLLRKKIGESLQSIKRNKRQAIRRRPQGRRRTLVQNTRQPTRQTFQRPVVQTTRRQGGIPPDKVRHEVRSPNYDMVWGRFANRTQRLANFSVSGIVSSFISTLISRGINFHNLTRRPITASCFTTFLFASLYNTCRM